MYRSKIKCGRRRNVVANWSSNVRTLGDLQHQLRSTDVRATRYEAALAEAPVIYRPPKKPPARSKLIASLKVGADGMRLSLCRRYVDPLPFLSDRCRENKHSEIHTAAAAGLERLYDRDRYVHPLNQHAAILNHGLQDKRPQLPIYASINVI